MPGGFAGVDIFFVISGFIVSASVGGLDRTSLWKFIPYFYARRLQRIAPALVACLLATTLASTVLIPPAWLSDAHQKTGLYAFFGLSNFILARTNNDYFSPTAEFNPFTHTWSLGVEEQFYFIFPFLFFAWTFRESRRVSLGLFAVALLASFVYSMSIAKSDATTAFYMITSRFWQLGAGVLLYQLMTSSGRRFDQSARPPPRWAGAAAFVSLALVVYGLVFARPGTSPLSRFDPCRARIVRLVRFPARRRPRESTGPRSNQPADPVHRPHFILAVPLALARHRPVPLDGRRHRRIASGGDLRAVVRAGHRVLLPCRAAGPRGEIPEVNAALGGRRDRKLVAVFLSARLANAIAWRHEALSVSTVARHMGDWYPEASDPKPIAAGCSVRTRQAGNIQEYQREGCPQPISGPTVFAIGAISTRWLTTACFASTPWPPGQRSPSSGTAVVRSWACDSRASNAARNRAPRRLTRRAGCAQETYCSCRRCVCRVMRTSGCDIRMRQYTRPCSRRRRSERASLR